MQSARSGVRKAQSVAAAGTTRGSDERDRVPEPGGALRAAPSSVSCRVVRCNGGRVALDFSASAAEGTVRQEFQGSSFPLFPAINFWTVPAGVTEVQFEVYGARGGDGCRTSGGWGGLTTATIRVTPGEVLQIWPGSRGGDLLCWEGLAPGGANGGADSGLMVGQLNGAGGGGGASDVRRFPYGLADRILTAGGGGGKLISSRRSKRGGDDFVFGATGRSPFSPSYVRATADRAWKVAGIPRVTLHECKHGQANFLDTAGISEARLTATSATPERPLATGTT